jgi:hypothetical protein
MRERRLCLVALLMAILGPASFTRAEDITFYWNGVIDSNESYDTVYVYDINIPPLPLFQTIVDVYGRADELCTYDSSVVNLFADGRIYYNIYLDHSSTLNFCGGFWGEDAGYLIAHNSSTVNIYDGLAGLTSMAMVLMWDSSTANVYGGIAGALILCEDSSTFNVYDGHLSHLGVYETSTANIYGGDIFGWGFQLSSSATANIYGHSFTYDPEAVWWGEPNDGWWLSRLTGFGCDGTAISILGDIPDPCTHSNINLIPDFVLPRGVDFADYAVLAAAWRSSPGDDNWNQICDISEPNDSIVDERDLDVLGKYWLAGLQ